MSTTAIGSSPSNASATSGLMLLPEELFVQTMHYLAFDDVKCLSLINKKLRKYCRARLFAKIIIDLPDMKDGPSMQDCIRSNYRHFPFVRILELHVGYQKSDPKRTQKGDAKQDQLASQDLSPVIEDFAAFFALLQISITDIHYNFYARNEDAYHALERTLFSKIMKIILSGYRLEHIRGHLHAGSLFRRDRASKDRIPGLVVALPFFQSPHHMHAITADSRFVASEGVSDILAALPHGCQPAHCKFVGWCLPEDDLERLPQSLRGISLSLLTWETFGSGSWVKLLRKVQKTCPEFVSLAIDIRRTEMNLVEAPSTESIEGVLQLDPGTVEFLHARSLTFVCNLDCLPQLALRNAFEMLNAPYLTDLTLQGAPSWFSLSSLDLDIFLARTSLANLWLIETLNQPGATHDEFPWDDAPDMLSITRPLFGALVQRLEAAGVILRISAISNEQESISYGRTPDDEDFQVSLATIQDHVHHIEAQFFQPGPEEALQFDRSYHFPCLRSLKIYCSINLAISSIARTWGVPNLEVIDVHIVGDAREVALIVGDLTNAIKIQQFPSLRKLTGEIEGMAAQKSECHLEEMFRKAFRSACKAREINIDDLAWKPAKQTKGRTNNW